MSTEGHTSRSSDGQTIIIQQTQSQTQTQNGCCAGGGCGAILLLAILFASLTAAWEAMTGVYGLGWQIVTWIFVPVLLVLVVAGGFAALDQHFGWGYTAEAESTPAADTREPADVLMEETLNEQNYGTVTPSQGDLAEKLQQLSDLRDRGLITNEDFESKKQDLLDDM